jgi:hypothetical protein
MKEVAAGGSRASIHEVDRSAPREKLMKFAIALSVAAARLPPHPYSLMLRSIAQKRRQTASIRLYSASRMAVMGGPHFAFE